MKIQSIKMLALASIALLGTASCKKQTTPLQDNPTGLNPGNATAALITSDCVSPYTINLESIDYVNGYYEWVWSIQNPNPGNGNNSTVQDLSHWDIALGGCLQFEDVVGAATSTDGITWISFQPTNQVDKSIKSMNTGNVIKFNLGTTGSAISYYKLIIVPDLLIDMDGTSYYKSGSKTGEGTQCYPGFRCKESRDESVFEPI